MSVLLAVLVALPALSSPQQHAAAGAEVYVPPSYQAGVPTPLVILLHGYGSSGQIQESYMQFQPLADEYGFLYLHPDGAVDSGGYRFWNATDACCNFYGSSVDHSAILRDLIEDTQLNFSVDERRIYLIGHSNGGFMSYRMACDHSDLIAAIASLAGATFFDPGACTPSEPVHTLQIHGTSDGTILYGGGALGGNQYPGAVASAETWATYDGCSLVADTSAPNLDLDAGLPGLETTVTRYESDCNPGGSAELWTIVGGSHVPNLSSHFSRLVVEWLYAHPKPGAGENACLATVNSTGEAASIDAAGSATIAAADLVLFAGPVPPNEFGLFYFGGQTIELPFGNGFRCVGSGGQGVFRLPVQDSGAAGLLEQAVDYGGAPAAGHLIAGSTWTFQAWFRDPAAGAATFNLSDAYVITFD